MDKQEKRKFYVNQQNEEGIQNEEDLYGYDIADEDVTFSATEATGLTPALVTEEAEAESYEMLSSVQKQVPEEDGLFKEGKKRGKKKTYPDSV